MSVYNVWVCENKIKTINAKDFEKENLWKSIETVWCVRIQLEWWRYTERYRKYHGWLLTSDKEYEVHLNYWGGIIYDFSPS